MCEYLRRGAVSLRCLNKLRRSNAHDTNIGELFPPVLVRDDANPRRAQALVRAVAVARVRVAEEDVGAMKTKKPAVHACERRKSLPSQLRILLVEADRLACQRIRHSTAVQQSVAEWNGCVQ